MVRGKIKIKRYRFDYFNIAFWVSILAFCLTVWGLAAKGLFCIVSESL